jgi:transcriptional regulator with XRE-family HTH domain
MNREELIQQGVIDAFATFVIDRRKFLGMTQEDLATAAGWGLRPSNALSLANLCRTGRTY